MQKKVFNNQKNIFTFVTSYTKEGKSDACRLNVASFFYARNLIISGSVPPCVSVIDPLPSWCKTAGKAEPFFLAFNLIFCKMSYTEKQIGNANNKNSVTTNKIINEFLSYDDVTNVKNSLTKFFLEWVQSDLDYTKKEREKFVFHYQSLVLLLDALLLFKSKKTAKNLTN